MSAGDSSKKSSTKRIPPSSAELSETDKERDKGNVLRISDLVREMGWVIVPASARSRERQR